MSKSDRFESAALRVNLEKTRSESLSVPESHQRLLDVTSGHYGIHKRVRQFLEEYHHRYPNRDTVVESLRQMLLQDLWFHAQQEDAEELFVSMLDTCSTLFSPEYSLPLRKRTLQTLLEFIEQLYEQEDHSGFHAVFARALELLKEVVNRDDKLRVLSSTLLRHILTSIPKEPSWRPLLTELLKKSLTTSLKYWQQEAPIESWLVSRQPLFSSPQEAVISFAGKPFFDEQRTILENADDWDDLLKAADYQAVAQRLIEASELFGTTLERISYLFLIIHLPGMDGSREQLLWDVNRALKTLRQECDESEFQDFLNRIFGIFVELRDSHMHSVLDCILTLGREVHAANSQRLIDAFIDHLVDFGFVKPELSGVTEEWQVNVDRNHVHGIRVWLALIELQPASWHRLLSALIISMKLHGVFISDTDLFQRDVTALLNSDIGPVYYLVKQLAVMFPVYFNEIGAEGELRDTSTVIDELSQRHDRLIHFLRKQVHAESNNLHITLVDAILRYWFDGTTESLAQFLPSDVITDLNADGKWYASVHAAVRGLCATLQLPPELLSTQPIQHIEAVMDGMGDIDGVQRTRVRHLIRIKQLLSEKYTIDIHGIVPHMEKLHVFRRVDIEDFERMLVEDDAERILTWVLESIRRLRNVILDPEQTSGIEDIYYKRHIAAGIPSMYGRYLEPKFQALGLTFRFEALASLMIERMVSDTNLRYITASTLQRIYRILKYLTESLAIEGLSDEGFTSTLEMFRYSLTTTSFSIYQFMNLFHFMSGNVKGIIAENFIHPHDTLLTRIIHSSGKEQPGIANDADVDQQVHARSEQFYRDLIAGTFPVPQLDSFIASVIASLNEMVRHLPADIIQHAMTYDSRLISTRLYQENTDIDNPVFLGAKGYYLKRLMGLGFPVPPGFVLTTELFRRRSALTRHPDMKAEIHSIIRGRLRDLEDVTGKRYGDPDNPLLLSVRSGAAISIPGAMNTFLNVGMNDEIVERLSTRPNYGWTSWDCYRRFLQGWGMAYGIERDAFDGIMMHYKEEYGVTQKILFTPEQMRTIAFTYKQVLLDNDVHIVDEPFQQLIQAILSVLDSWYTDRARVYRNKLRIAEEWGTAVVIQSMVLGNLNYDSGTGVLFTRDPYIRDHGISLYGDFTICSQGEDIVGGLVHVLPISEQQRLRSKNIQEMSLESKFPEIYAELYRFAHELVNERDFSHQEIEFTFETSQAKDLHILQTRDQALLHESEIAVFDCASDALRLLGMGLGIGGGAMNGVLCFDLDDLTYYRALYSDRHMVLVRPDTVPDDIGMIFECDGLLTARGGAASHAAVTAVRLRKTCVVDCRDMIVDEEAKTCTIGSTTLSAGDALAIDGRLGAIYEGTYPISYEKLQLP